MNIQRFIDDLSVMSVFFVVAFGALLVFELGYRHGRWWQERTPEEREGPTAMLVGSLLSLMAFLLAITMGMASDRFHMRQSLVLEEANAIGTTYLRAGLLADPETIQIKALLRQYASLRTGSDDEADIQKKITQSAQLQSDLWEITEKLAHEGSESRILPLFIDSLNQTFDLHETRITAGIYARVPISIIMLLLLGAMLTMGMVGYNAGLTKRRSPLTAFVLVGVLSAVITLVIDLDRGQDGFLTVNQQPLYDVQKQLNVQLPER